MVPLVLTHSHLSLELMWAEYSCLRFPLVCQTCLMTGESAVLSRPTHLRSSKVFPGAHSPAFDPSGCRKGDPFFQRIAILSFPRYVGEKVSPLFWGLLVRNPKIHLSGNSKPPCVLLPNIVSSMTKLCCHGQNQLSTPLRRIRHDVFCCSLALHWSWVQRNQSDTYHWSHYWKPSKWVGKPKGPISSTCWCSVKNDLSGFGNEARVSLEGNHKGLSSQQALLPRFKHPLLQGNMAVGQHHWHHFGVHHT